jgi:hypothetical protein
VNRLRDAWLEIRIRIALHKFVAAQKAKTPEAYQMMHHYYWLIGQRSNSQVKYMEKRFH